MRVPVVIGNMNGTNPPRDKMNPLAPEFVPRDELTPARTLPSMPVREAVRSTAYHPPHMGYCPYIAKTVWHDCVRHETDVANNHHHRRVSDSSSSSGATRGSAHTDKPHEHFTRSILCEVMAEVNSGVPVPGPPPMAPVYQPQPQPMAPVYQPQPPPNYMFPPYGAWQPPYNSELNPIPSHPSIDVRSLKSLVAAMHIIEQITSTTFRIC